MNFFSLNFQKIKKNLIVIALFFSTMTQALNQSTNQTFMFPKEIFGSYAMEQASWHNILYNKYSHGAALQAYGYAQGSIPTNTASEYFSFDYLPQLMVQSGTPENYDVETFTRNILGAWIGIEGDENFSGSYSLTPQQSQYGATIAFSQDLSKYFDVAYLRNSSFTLSIPIVAIKNQLVFQGSPTILNALQGGNWMTMNLTESWQYLILNEEIQESTQLTNMKIQFGSKYESDDDVQIATTSFLTLPFVQSVSNEVLFQPAFGYNGHIVLGSGVVFQFPLTRSQDRLTRICFFAGLENKFLFGNNQERTVEIDGKPYSRYMPLYDRYTDSMVPGVNVFTKNCLVEPFNIIDFIAGFRYKYIDCIGEIGYELWGHDTERITINDTNPWQENRYGIANINGQGELDPTIKTASRSTINYVVPDIESNKYIKASQLNMVTGASRATLVHRAYMSYGYGKKTGTVDYIINLGLFIEVVQNNAAFSNFGGWLKTGATF
ncbi:hypothetical protein KBC04_01010 [Candidatus Babeliales bacterium]|nr:hypothetical protein [Candidatus Babeliales bacterium]MBP9843685.1 hypothetical protein [Candidatus Babeliales bacterium]